MNAIVPNLTIHQISADGSTETSEAVLRPSGYVVFSCRDEPEHHQAVSLDEVVRTSHLLRLRADNEIHIHHAAAITRDALLDALQVHGEPLPPDAWDLADDSPFWDLAESRLAVHPTCRILVNDTIVLSAESTDDGLVLVPAPDPGQPHNAWDELLAFHWDSSEYAGVGMAGFGTEGFYLVRPGVLATVSMTDEDYALQIECVDRDVTPVDLLRPRLHRAFPSDRQYALLDPDGPWNSDDVMPGDQVTTSLSATDVSDLCSLLGPRSKADEES